MEASVESPPYGAYATIMGVFAAGLAGAGGLARIFDRSAAPEPGPPPDWPRRRSWRRGSADC